MQSKDKEPKRAAILAASARMFDGRRFDAVKLDEISAAAGVGKGTLYLYFKNKEDLFAQMAIEGIDEMTERINKVTAMDLPFKERLFLFGYEFADFLARRHGVTQAMNQAQSACVEKTFHTHHNRMIEAIHELFRKGMAEGVLRNDMEEAELRCALVGPVILKVRRKANVGEAIELEPLLDFFWKGAAAVQKK